MVGCGFGLVMFKIVRRVKAAMIVFNGRAIVNKEFRVWVFFVELSKQEWWFV